MRRCFFCYLIIIVDKCGLLVIIYKGISLINGGKDMKKFLAIFTCVIFMLILSISSFADATIIDDYGSTLNQVRTAVNYSRNYIISPTASIISTQPGTDYTDIHSTNPHGSNPTDPHNTNPSTPGSNPSNTNPGGSNPSGTDPNGSNPSGTNPNGSNPNGSNPNGTDPNGNRTTRPVTSDLNPHSPDTSAEDTNVTCVLLSVFVLFAGVVFIFASKKKVTE